MPCKRFAEPTLIDVHQAVSGLCDTLDALTRGYLDEYELINRLCDHLNALGSSWTLPTEPGRLPVIRIIRGGPPPQETK